MKQQDTQTRGEEIANSISHLVMALSSFVMLIFLILKSDSLKDYLGATVFAISVFLLYGFSTIYHGLSDNKAKWQVFKRLDHTSIYFLIGGTYTPLLLQIQEFEKSLFGIPILTISNILLFLMWTIIITGVVFKSIWINKFKYIHLAFYLLLGWSAIFYFKYIYAQSLQGFLIILIGGISYTIGVLFYVFPKIKYFHFVWHIFVAIGTISHFLALYFFYY
ncbi:MAG: hemolysin III family protein [Acholeplasmatales bacterium]|jgi:hemolysin III|nr:hemolysin III family protein [Acholeplasmatales bacterium]